MSKKQQFISVWDAIEDTPTEAETPNNLTDQQPPPFEKLLALG
jgi:predicted XRE-type DNA-binding protein